jgi:asparagine synthase (glutamine-hydrolysing)
MAKLANVVDENGLIPEERWKKVIDEVRSRTSGKPDKERLKKSIIEAVKKRIPGEPFAVFFSGGIDSALIALVCKQLGLKFKCYAVGFQHENTEIPQDIWYAREMAKKFNLDYVEKIYNIKEARDVIKEAIKIFPKPKEFNADYYVTINVASVVIAAKKIAKEKIFFSGLGTEEIFAGYNRHLKVSDVNEECWRGLREMWSRDLYRDVTLGTALGIDLLVPFLDEEVIIEAMKFEGNKKINKEHKKIILREVAEELGLPKEFAWRKKQGAQYGSKFDLAIEKLTKMNGFKLKQEYIESLMKEVKR